MTDNDDPGRSIGQMFGGLLMAAGVLIAGLCGLCSLGFIGMSVGGSELGMMIGLALLFGGPPIGIGVGLYFWGRWLWRGRQGRS